MERLKGVLRSIGGETKRLVIDLSCRKGVDTWYVAMNKWQTITEFEVTKGKVWTWMCLNYRQGTDEVVDNIKLLEEHCSEFLIHAADNEGLQQGIDEQLVQRLAEWCSIPVTYAGGGKSFDDLERVKELSGGKVDLTIGSALDIFGGSAVRFEDCVLWNKRQ